MSPILPRLAAAQRPCLTTSIQEQNATGRQGARVMDQIKFVALDREDLEVVPPICRMPWSRWRTSSGGRRKSAWWSASAASTGKAPAAPSPPIAAARRAALRAGPVLQVPACESGRQGRRAQLLAVEFTETDAPAGVVTLKFSGGADAAARGRVPGGGARRLGPSWGTAACPAACRHRRRRRRADSVDGPALRH